MEKNIRSYGMEDLVRRSHYNKPHGKEAFQSAKNQFWAELNGIPCDVNFPNPDLYIDDVDWDYKIDDQLLSDLDCRCVIDKDEKSGPAIIFGDSLMPNLPYSSTGWGETTDMIQNVKDDDNQWRCNFEKTNGRVKQKGTGEIPDNSWHLDESSSRPVRDRSNVPINRNINSHGSWGTWDDSNANRLKAGMSRYKVSRFHVEDHNFNYSRINEKGKKGETFAWEQNYPNRRSPSGVWNFNARVPVSPHASDNAKHTQSWRKAVP